MTQRPFLPTLFTFLTCASFLALTSCALDTLEIPEGERYTREFIKQLGPIDRGHDWNLSQRVTISLASPLHRGVATVNVYNKMPGSPGCQIAACFTPDVQSFGLDFPASASVAWVDGRDADGNVIFGDYYDIKDGTIRLGASTSRAVVFPSGTYTCEDLSGYKAYEVKAVYDRPYGEPDRTVIDYEWTPTDRSVFGTFPSAHNPAMWDGYDFFGKTSSEVFAEVIESVERINLSEEEKAETIIYSKNVNNTANKFEQEGFNNNPWPFHLGNGNSSFLVQEVEREEDERDFSKLDGKIVLWQGVKKYIWQQDGRDRIGYFWDAGSEWGLVLNKAYTMSHIAARKNTPNIRMRLNVYYSIETEQVPTFATCEPMTVDCYMADGSACGRVSDIMHKVVDVNSPSLFSWRITSNWNSSQSLSYFKDGEKAVSLEHDTQVGDGLYISSIILNAEQIKELFDFDKAVIRGHGLVIDRVTVQLLDVDDAPAIPAKVIKPAGVASINEAVKFYAVKNDDQYLQPSFDSDSPGTSLQELMNLVGEHGVFNEGVNAQSHLCNMIRYKDKLPSMGEGVTFEVGDDGSGGSEVALHFLYGATGFNDCFGYFYYKGDRPTDEQLMKLPKYILIHNARPQRNLMANTGDGQWHHRPYDTGLDEVVRQIDNGVFDGEVPRVRRSQYKLVNFGYGDTPDPIGTTKFEAGTKIGFFMILSGYTKFWGGKDNYKNVDDQTIRWMTPDDMTISPSDIAFSFPEMNRNLGHVFSVNHRHDISSDGDPDNRGGFKYQPQDAEDDGFMAFTRYSYGGYPLLSVEDWGVKGDHDMNDMIFYVSGVRTDDVKPVGTPVVQQSWLLLAEDLGGTFDLDFNDAVIGISHVATNIETIDDGSASSGGLSSHDTTYGRVYLTGLAAGGTLPLEVLYDGKPIGDYDIKAKDIKYFHEWFGLDGPRVTNAMGYDSGLVRSFLLSGIPDFNIAPVDGATHSAGTALSRFSIVVWRDGERKELKQFWTGGAEGVGEMDLAAPQMLIIPTSPDDTSCWKYPYECTPVYEAYPAFKEWVGNKNRAIDWYKESNRATDVRVINHGWNGIPAQGM